MTLLSPAVEKSPTCADQDASTGGLQVAAAAGFDQMEALLDGGPESVNAEDVQLLGAGPSGSSKPAAAEVVAGTNKGNKRKNWMATHSDRSPKFNQGPSERSSSDEAVEREEEESGGNEEGDEAGALKKRKRGPQHHTPKPKKRKMQEADTGITRTLADVEAVPPKISHRSVSKWGYRPDGSTCKFVFPLHENSMEHAHAEKPMLEQLQNAMERQQRLCGNRAFVRHDPERLPTQRACADEPNSYLYQNGRNLFISGMLVGELNGGLEESKSSSSLVDGLMDDSDSEWVTQAAEIDKKYGVNINRYTTLRQFQEHANKVDGLVLNALELPLSHSPHPNPLAGGGLQTDSGSPGLASFGAATPPNEKKYFDIVGTKWKLTQRWPTDRRRESGTCIIWGRDATKREEVFRYHGYQVDVEATSYGCCRGHYTVQGLVKSVGL
ncbi:hypothetical protein DFH08DRAFT_818450 [Mycena albidolilacea]|uniref:Uncharacterized protein n=1 Tax=Mycena albidolilacea TaxID=1033008 RepID=A0AAD6ZGT0_9AGAR|nr:hypothetical protein DFH08DRAFT_818450 [Mycena albidolilacea]